jgi:hypothetical protein
MFSIDTFWVVAFITPAYTLLPVISIIFNGLPIMVEVDPAAKQHTFLHYSEINPAALQNRP